MSAAHTPGPWSIDDTGYRAFNNGLCIMAWPECVAVVGAGNPDQPQDANARLIAESPNLLKVLADLVANQDATWVAAGFTDEQIKAMPYLKPARAAIAKAGGAA